jgi:HEAT repeat protein/energy-coupling factor transporter ATP-binding protein EcfA2
MTQSRKPRSIAATPEGLQRLRDTRKELDWTNEKISAWTYEKYGNAGVSVDSVKNFITNNKPVEPGTVQKITEALGLKPEDVVDPQEWRVVIGEVKRDRKSSPNIDSREECQLKRSVLGLKGNYQEAQEKITEITQHLQTFLNDKTLSIANIEEGSIIIIVESSQSDYDQIKKRLIGQEIAGFPVEYVIDEWQDVCRRMLKKQTQLTSNSVLRRAYCNRNLIDEDLFVDLALVQPKKDRPSQYQQDIEPDRGSQFYTQQEVEKRFAYPEFLKEVISQRSQKNIAIIGEPGAGKTTLLQKLAFWLLQETDDLVVWVDLGKFGNQPLDKHFDKHLKEDWLDKALIDATEQIKADWRRKFDEGAVWLLLDGLDEMGDTARQSLEFQGWVTQAQLIISCRLNLWQANPPQLWDFQTYLTQPFQDEQMQQFIQRWFRNLSGEKQDVELAESLWSALQNSGKERIKDLCRNPLRLTLLCPIWQDEQGDLPDTTAELYESFVESIYKWKKKEFPMKKAERDSLNAGLGELAKASLDDEGIRFRLTHRFVCKYLGEPDENSLLDSALKLGWLNEVGVAAENRRERVYAFYHATFQEYFAALAVDDWDYFLPRNHVNLPVEEKGNKYRIFEPQWKQVILLWLGRDVDKQKKEGFIRALINFEDGCGEWSFERVDREFYEYKAYFLAAVGINEFKTCSLAADIVRQVVKWGFGYFNNQKPEWITFLDPIREGARKAIPETIRPLAITELTAILKHCSDENTRMRAAESLGQIDKDNPVAIAALVKLIRTTQDQYTRMRAAESLGQIDKDNPVAIAALVVLIGTTLDEYTLMQAAESLGKIDKDNPVAIAALVVLIGTTLDEDTRFSAAYSLGEIGKDNPEAIDALVGLIRTTQNEDTRMQSAYSLGKIGKDNPVAIAALVELIGTTQDEYTLMQAAYSLGKIGKDNPVAINTLEELIRTTQNEDTRIWAASSLGEIDKDNPVAISALEELIRTTQDEYTRMEAASSLGEIDKDNPEAIDALVGLIRTTQNEDTRIWPASSLGEIGKDNPVAISALEELIRTTQDEYTRKFAASSLGQIDKDNSVAIAALVELIRTTQDEDTRRLEASSLGKILTEPQQMLGVVSALKDCLSDEVYQNNFKRFDECYKVVWHCAANLPYPQFYQAWHHPPTTPYPRNHLEE